MLVTCDEAATAVPVIEISAVVNVVVQLAVFDAMAQLTSIVLGSGQSDYLAGHMLQKIGNTHPILSSVKWTSSIEGPSMSSTPSPRPQVREDSLVGHVK